MLRLASRGWLPALRQRTRLFSTEDASAGIHQSPIVQKLWLKRQKREAVKEHVTPEDSASSVVYEFSTDHVLRDMYSNPWGLIRLGRMLEDLDALAGNIAADHVEVGCSEDLIVVTASVDRINVKHRANVRDDMTMSGRVVYVGKSSMEIHMEVCSNWTTEPWLKASFVFVARTMDGKAAIVPPLVVTNPKDVALFEQCMRKAELLRAKRKKSAREALVSSNDPAPLQWPSEKAAVVARALLAEARVHLDLPALTQENTVFFSNTQLTNTIICMPQQRNTRGRIFGGFLMRRAFELAFANTYMFTGVQPLFREVDEVQFLSPVSVGDLLRFESHVLFTTQHTNRTAVFIEVVATITRPEKRDSKISNKFYFTFETPSPAKLARVLPVSLEEAVRIVTRMHLEDEMEAVPPP